MPRPGPPAPAHAALPHIAPAAQPLRRGTHAMLAALALQASSTWAAAIPTTASFAVNAAIVPGCMVSGNAAQVTGVAFGQADFGTHSAVNAGTLWVIAGAGSGGQASLQCTPGTTVQVTVNGGLHALGAQRRLANGAGRYIPYVLDLMAGIATPLAPNVPASLALGSTATTLPVRATAIMPGTGLAAGLYTDTVQVTLSW